MRVCANKNRTEERRKKNDNNNNEYVCCVGKSGNFTIFNLSISYKFMRSS